MLHTAALAAGSNPCCWVLSSVRLQLAAAERIMLDQRQEVAVFRDDRAIAIRDDEIGLLKARLDDAERVKEELASLLAEVRKTVVRSLRCTVSACLHPNHCVPGVLWGAVCFSEKRSTEAADE